LQFWDKHLVLGSEVKLNYKMPPVSELISQILLKKLRHEELTRSEAATLAEWESRSPEHKAFIEMLMDEALLSDKLKGMLQPDQQPAWQKIENALQADWNERGTVERKPKRYKYAVAASIVLVLGVTGYFVWMAASGGNDIVPGQDRARLILSNGSVIDLVTAAKGEVAKDSGVTVVKEGEGKVGYEVMNSLSQTIDWYNTLETPRGGKFQLTLPDSTVVFLNAASSIRYPTVFSGRERKVEITGEAYFEVAKNPYKTFVVQVNNGKNESRAIVEALGTHFNIMAYDDEEVIRTTLLEGKVGMGASRDDLQGINSQMLFPGQQAQLNAKNDLSVISVDVEQAVAWKNGEFFFTNADLKSVMRQISRWYDVEIVYEGEIPDTRLSGRIRRSANISSVLDIVKYAGRIKLKIEKGKITVFQ
jgi:transmembrane sensor